MPQFTWNDNWRKSDESQFSILNKFLFANSISSTQLKAELNDDIRFLLNAIGVRKELIVSFLSSRKTNVHLKYCPLCIQHGYHSNSHQIFDYCHIHGEKLNSTCSDCGRIIFYDQITSKVFKETYICICGQALISYEDLDLITLWNECNKSEIIVDIRQIIICPTFTEVLNLRVNRNDLFDIFITANKATSIFLKNFTNKKYQWEHYELNPPSFFSDLVTEKDTIREGYEIIVKKMIESNNYMLSPFIKKLDFSIKTELKKAGLDYRDYKKILHKCYGELSHFYFINPNRYENAFPLILSVLKILFQSRTINQISQGVYSNHKKDNDTLSLRIPCIHMTWYKNN